MRGLPIKFPEQRLPTRGLNLTRDGRLNLAEWDGINRLPVEALEIGLDILLGGEELLAQNYYDPDNEVAGNGNEDVIEDTELYGYYLRGFHVNGTGDAIVSLWATVMGRGTTSSTTSEWTLIAQGTIDIDKRYIKVMLPNPVRVCDDGKIKLNISNIHATDAADYSSIVFGFSYTGGQIAQ